MRDLNIFKGFRTPGRGDILSQIRGGFNPITGFSKDFDEPTYLSFFVRFKDINTEISEATNYDSFPNPLLKDSGQIVDSGPRNFYSTKQFLRDSNELVRAEMMDRFINGIRSLQENYQWYFQSIGGLENLKKAAPKRGIRVPTDARITLTMLEGLDWRVSYLMDLYKKISWDDTYQRWILPDMMRWFALDIYITEFRIFHTGRREEGDLILSVIQDVMPTYIIHCEQCEFDLESFAPISTLSAISEEQAARTFSIKVGNIWEEKINPILNFYWSDRRFNSRDRVSENLNSTNVIGNRDESTIKLNLKQNPDNPGSLKDVGPNSGARNYSEHKSGAPFLENPDGRIIGAYSTIVDETREMDPRTWTGEAVNFGKAFTKNLVNQLVDIGKITPLSQLSDTGIGASFNEATAALRSKNILASISLVKRAIDNTIFQTIAPSSRLEGKISTSSGRRVAPEKKSLLGEKIDSVIDSASPIPETFISDGLDAPVSSSLLGDSISGGLDAPGSSSLLGSSIVDGLDRPIPSDSLFKEISDSTFKAFLEGVVSSKATDENSDLIQIASRLLSSGPSGWEELKDFSLATNLTSEGEVNIQKEIKSAFGELPLPGTAERGKIAPGSVFEAPSSNNRAR